MIAAKVLCAARQLCLRYQTATAATLAFAADTGTGR